MGDFLNLFFSSLVNAIAISWWVLLPLFLVPTFWKLRLFYKRSIFLSKMKWKVLEIKISKELLKTPKSMEHVFNNLFGIHSFGITPWDKYLDGKIEEWMSFEIVGRRDGIHFYVRMTEGRRNLVESAIYAQYPEVEITEVDDYVNEFPSILPNDTYDLWGAGFKLTAKNPLPIRTYEAFEEVKDEKRVDPLSAIMETMTKFKEDETIWLQLLISPVSPLSGIDLKKEADGVIEKLKEEKGGKTEDGKAFGVFRLSHGDQEIIKGIEGKASKLYFQFSLRFIYIDKKEKMTPSNWGAVMASFQQFNTRNMNGFRPDELMTLYGKPYGRLFPKVKKMILFGKKRKLYDFCVKRRFGYSGRIGDEDLPIMNSEELATIFHFPSLVVKAPTLRHVHSRKSEPPPNLPVD